MAKYRGPRAKISRKFGVPILGCERILKKKNYPPGQHGKVRKRKSGFALQLQETQKVRYRYGISKVQLRSYVKKALSRKGISGHLLMQRLEMNLDNVVCRLGICKSNASARHFVNHGHIEVNGKVVNKPLYEVKKGDTITVSPRAKTFTCLKENSDSYHHKHAWLAQDLDNLSGTVLEVPDRKVIPEDINEKRLLNSMLDKAYDL